MSSKIFCHRVRLPSTTSSQSNIFIEQCVNQSSLGPILRIRAAEAREPQRRYLVARLHDFRLVPIEELLEHLVVGAMLLQRLRQARLRDTVLG